MPRIRTEQDAARELLAGWEPTRPSQPDRYFDELQARHDARRAQYLARRKRSPWRRLLDWLRAPAPFDSR